MSFIAFLERFSINTIEVLFIFSYLVLISLMMGLTIFSNNTYRTVQTSLQLLLSLYIVYKFNPFTRKTYISDMERRIIFSCGIYLLLASIPYHFLASIYL